MRLNKITKKLLAVICSVAMIMSSITMENLTAKAADDSEYASLKYTDIVKNNNNKLDQGLKGCQYSIVTGTLNVCEFQNENAGFGELYMAVGEMGAGNFKATVNGKDVTKTEGTGIFMNPAADFLTYKYNVVEISSDDGSAKVIILNPNKEGTYKPETPAETKPEVTEPAETTEASETESQTETESVSETESQTETESVSETESQTETESVSETESQTETESVSETESQTETESVSETESQTETVNVPTEGSTQITTIENTEKNNDTCSHVWSEWKVVKKAGYNSKGEENRICNKCKKTEQREITKYNINVSIVGNKNKRDLNTDLQVNNKFKLPSNHREMLQAYPELISKGCVFEGIYLNGKKIVFLTDEYNGKELVVRCRSVRMRLKSVKVAKGTVVFKFKNKDRKNIDGYKITYSTSKKFDKKLSKSFFVKLSKKNTKEYTFNNAKNKLVNGRMYYFKVEFYYKVNNKKNYYIGNNKSVIRYRR